MESKIARFDTRWTEEQKSFFERASLIGGFRSLSEFVLSAVQQRAYEIVENHDRIIASQKDQKVFIDALLNPSLPNEKLRQAAENFKDVIEDDGVPNRSVRVKS